MNRRKIRAMAFAMPRRARITAAHLFIAATLGPVPLLLLGALLGGVWIWLALGTMMVLFVTLDRLVERALLVWPSSNPGEFPTNDRLCVALALAHLAVLGTVIAALSGAPGGLASAGLFVAAGLWLGQVSNSNAHELIHRPQKALFRTGMWIYISLLFGHHTSAHRRVHHRLVASAQDPNSARLGESFWAFAPRAWLGSFRAGWRAESALLARHGGASWVHHPYLVYGLGAAGCLALVGGLGGLPALIWYVALAIYAQTQLLLSDYVQHYGLMRDAPAPGRLAPVGAAHSWNAPHAATGTMLLHAPRHSDHHAHPGRPFPDLRIASPAEMPTLPYALPVMAVIALFPPLWRRLMDPHAAQWRPKEQHLAA